MGERGWARRALPQRSPRRPPSIHRTMPAVAENSAHIANLVDDTTTTANSDIHSHPCSTASNPGPSTPEFSPSPDQRFHQRTSSGVRRTCGITAHTLTSSDSGLTADRPVLDLIALQGQLSRGLLRGRLDYVNRNMPGATCTATYPTVTEYCRHRIFFRVFPSFFAYSKCF